jgi:phage gp29-like protein
MMMKYPQGASEQLKSTLKSIMSNLSSKTDVLIPEGVVIELVEATRAGTAKYDEALTHYDVRIATAILIPALLGMGGSDIKKGADSQSRLQLRTLMKVIQHVGNELAQITKEKIIKPLVDANFNVKEYPDFIFQDYGEFEAFEITDAIKEMWNAGILDLDQEDINFARSILGMSIRAEDQEDETNRPDPSMASQPFGMNQPGGGGADQGNDRAKKAISNKKTDQTGRQRPSRR